MAIGIISGSTSPLSAATTLTATPTTEFKANPLTENAFKKSASDVIEFIASRSSTSSSVYVYDVAEQVGFGTLTKSWQGSIQDTAPVVSLQTRAGAGLSLVGRLSAGTSQDAARGAVLTAYTTPAGLAAMTQSLSYLPPPSAASRLIIQVPTVTSVGEAFALSPTLASLANAFTLLPENIVILLSASPQESIDLTTLSYKLTSSHVIHLFDHHSSTREVGHAFSAPLPFKEGRNSTVSEALQWSGYSFFDYAGDEHAHTVIVLLNGPLALMAKALVGRVDGLGVVVVRVLRPWDEAAFRNVVPESVKEVHVFDDVPNEATQGSLYVDVFGSLYDPSSPGVIIRAHRVTPEKTQKYISQRQVFWDAVLQLAHKVPLLPALDSSKRLLFFGTPASPLAPLPSIVKDTFARTMPTRLLTDHDVFSKPGGVSASRIVLSQSADAADQAPLCSTISLGSSDSGEADFLGILDASLLKSHSLLKHAKPGSAVLVVTPWSSAELLSNLPSDVLALISDRKLRIYTIDAKTCASDLAGGPVDQDAVQNILVYVSFLRLYLGKAATEPLVRKLVTSTTQEAFHTLDLTKITARAWVSLSEVELPANVSSAEDDAQPKTSADLKDFEFNAIAVETEDGETTVNGARLGSWHDAAKHLLFPSVFTPPLGPSAETEEYPQNPALRPEVPERTFLVTCTVNRRLTPIEYNRNVFHLEFDTTGTGLKYAIGEALGVHGWNDEREVLDFCAWYGVDPNRLVTIPVLSGDGRMHTRTTLQALQQQIDLFGRPPKSFYTDLAPYATNATDKYALQFIGSPEGSSTFKKFAEKDTVTFAEVLQRYPSAKPGIETLCEMIGDIKPRHYSIASAQSVVGDRVDLLVVTVDWLTPGGSPRYGQCTRYLADLKIGQKVTVSVRPSVMKLPPDHKQPIIMAGLGTGAAPFRAFLQYRAQLAQQGVAVGPTYYYFGARYQASEYLYGEEIEAFILDGTITKAGLAFSRDSAKKVYIQHLMLQDAQMLAGKLKNEEGVFYLCGPTWPVPDVYEALVGALVKHEGHTPETAGAFLEGLKEEERYVLEVY